MRTSTGFVHDASNVHGRKIVAPHREARRVQYPDYCTLHEECHFASLVTFIRAHDKQATPVDGRRNAIRPVPVRVSPRFQVFGKANFELYGIFFTDDRPHYVAIMVELIWPRSA